MGRDLELQQDLSRFWEDGVVRWPVSQSFLHTKTDLDVERRSQNLTFNFSQTICSSRVSIYVDRLGKGMDHIDA